MVVEIFYKIFLAAVYRGQVCDYYMNSFIITEKAICCQAGMAFINYRLNSKKFARRSYAALRALAGPRTQLAGSDVFQCSH